MINEKDRLISSGQLSNNKDLMTHSKNNRNMNVKNSQPHNQGSTSSSDDASNMVYKKKNSIILVNIMEKPTTLRIFALNEDVKLRKKRRILPMNNMYPYVPIMLNLVNHILMQNG